MYCPSCNVEMRCLTISGVTIDECPRCYGLWFDLSELKQLDESHEGAGKELQTILSRERAADFDPTRKVKCPKCKLEMERHEYLTQSGIYIDECFSCGGVWLDRGELKAIRDTFKSSAQIEDVVEKMLAQDPTYRAYLQKQGLKSSPLSKLSKLSFS